MSRFTAVPADRRDRLDSMRERRSLEAVWFARPNGFAWVTGGSNVVDRAADVGVAAVGYDGTQVRVVTSNIEADRLQAEELPDDTALESYDWYAESLADAVATRSSEPAQVLSNSRFADECLR